MNQKGSQFGSFFDARMMIILLLAWGCLALAEGNASTGQVIR